MQSRQTKYGAYSGVYILVFVAILGAVNYLSNQYNKTFDATEDQLYSLSDQTKKVLNNLDRDVTVYYFDQRARFPGAKNSLVRFENISSRVKVSYIDPDSQPDMAKAMNVRTYGTVVLEVGANREESKSTSEEDITNSIIKALKGEAKTACMLSGHGEADPEDAARDGFQLAKAEIEGANYTPRKISLLESPKVPDDCTLLIVAGPQSEYLEPEIEILKGYVEAGGRALFMLDHEQGQSLAQMLAGWGIQVNDDVVVDLSSIGRLFGGGPLTPLVAEYESHPIGRVMEGVATFFPMTRSVRAGDAPSGWSISPLYKTTADAFATTNLDVKEGELVRHADAETQGPINLGVAATYAVPEAAAAPKPEGEEAAPGDEIPAAAKDDEKPEGRVVAVGTSLFVRNNFVSRGGNADLFLNMLNWLSSDEDLISIRPKDPSNTPLDISESNMRWLFLGTVIGFPLIIIITGVRVWWIRR